MTTQDHKTIRIWPATLKALRLVAALTGERMVQVLDRLVSAELDRIQNDSRADSRAAGATPDVSPHQEAE